MLGRMLWPLIRGRCLVHDKYYHLDDVHEAPLPDPKSHFGAGHQNIAAVLGGGRTARHSAGAVEYFPAPR